MKNEKKWNIIHTHTHIYTFPHVCFHIYAFIYIIREYMYIFPNNKIRNTSTGTIFLSGEILLENRIKM